MIKAKYVKTALGAVSLALISSIAVYQLKAHTKGIADER